MRWLNTDIVCQLNCGINDSSIRQRDIEEMLDLQEKKKFDILSITPDHNSWQDVKIVSAVHQVINKYIYILIRLTNKNYNISFHVKASLVPLRYSPTLEVTKKTIANYPYCGK